MEAPEVNRCMGSWEGYERPLGLQEPKVLLISSYQSGSRGAVKRHRGLLNLSLDPKEMGVLHYLEGTLVSQISNSSNTVRAFYKMNLKPR